MADLRQLPVAIQAEQALLGAILANNRAMDLCGVLRAEHFADPVHGRIFEECRTLINAGTLADAITLKAVFENTGVLDEVGGTAYLAQLLTAMIGITGVEAYARVIHDAWLRRQVIAIGTESVELAFGADTKINGEGAVATTIDRLLTLGANAKTESDDFAAALDTVLDAADAAHRGTGQRGLETGIAGLDAMWRGLWPGSLDILGARSEHGKTAMGIQIAEAVARVLPAGEHVQIVSLEMPRQDIALRMLASATGISADDIRYGRIGGKLGEELILARAGLRRLPLLIQDRSGMTLTDITMAARIAHRRKGLRLIVIDHLHRIAPDPTMGRASRLEQVQHATAGLKDLARSLDVPILLLAQLSRESERRDGPDGARPRVSDIQYAGERDGDNVILLWRPELHMGDKPPALPDRSKAETRVEHDASWHRRREAVRGKAEAIFAKRRFGPTGSVKLEFDGPRTRFSDVVEEPEIDPASLPF